LGFALKNGDYNDVRGGTSPRNVRVQFDLYGVPMTNAEVWADRHIEQRIQPANGEIGAVGAAH